MAIVRAPVLVSVKFFTASLFTAVLETRTPELTWFAMFWNNL